MKKRQGFVSNSSTSSFIIVGWETSRLDTSKFEDDEFDEFDYFLDDMSDMGCMYIDEGGSVPPLIGYVLADCSNEEMMDPGETSWDEALAEVNKVRDKIEEKFKVEGPPKLMWGTRMS